MFTQHVWYKYIHTLKLTLCNFFFFFLSFFLFFFADQQQILLSLTVNQYSINMPCSAKRHVLPLRILLRSKPWAVGVAVKEEVQEGLGMGEAREVAASRGAAETQEEKDSLEHG